jgi:hypothetical protein
MKKILAFTGVKFSGKTTAFNIIKEEIPGVIEIQLAKKLKDECAKVFKIDRPLFDDPNLKEVALDTPVYLDRENITEIIEAYGMKAEYDKHVRPHVGLVLESPRRVAQYIGTEVLRAVSSDIHCIGATMGLPENGVFVVTDMRFPNEYEYFKKNYSESFFPFYVQNNQAEHNGAKDMHPSERMVLETAKNCKPISNNDSMMEFRARVLAEVRKTNG